jgi:hypothetical protein
MGNNEMMTRDEIGLAKINPNVAKEAHDQASKRLADILEAKKTFEQKAFMLFNAYIALALALFGVGGALLKDKAATIPFTPFILTATLFVIGAGCFARVFLDKEYGSLGSDPDMWLRKGTLDGDDSQVSLMLTYITYYHKERISKSTEANNQKADLIRLGIYLGLATPVVLIVSLFFS